MPKRSNFKLDDYEFGNSVHALRKRTGLTQRKLALQLQVSVRTVISWETGVSYPHTDRLKLLFEFFYQRGAFSTGREEEEILALVKRVKGAPDDFRKFLEDPWLDNLLEVTNRHRNIPIPTHPENHIFLQLPELAHTHTPFRAEHHQDWEGAVEYLSFYGRDEVLTEIKDWLVRDQQRVICLYGLGGIGKTSLATNLAHQLAAQFDYVIFRSLQNGPTFEEYIDSILRFLLGNQLANVPVRAEEKLERVYDFLQKNRCLLLLDNLETIMQTDLAAGEFRPEFAHFDNFIGRLSDTSHRSTLLITSREKPAGLILREEKNSPVRTILLEGLDKEACRHILAERNVKCDDRQSELLSDRFGGNPLALKLSAESIREIFEGDIEAFLADESSGVNEIGYILDQSFKRLSLIEQNILYWLAIRREPVELKDLQKLLGRTGSGYGQTVTKGLRALFRRCLIEHSEVHLSYSLQEVVAEFVTNRLVEHLYGEIKEQKPDLLTRFPLLPTDNRQYIHQIQLRILIFPLLGRLQTAFNGNRWLILHLKHLLEGLRPAPSKARQPGFAGGNLLNLLIQLEADLENLDLHGLSLGHAHLKGVELPNVNLRGTDLTGTTFTEAALSAFTLAYQPDGSRLAIGCLNGSIKIWATEKLFGDLLLECAGHTGAVSSVVFSRTGKLLASSSFDGTVRVWHLETGACQAVLKGSSALFRAVAFSPDGHWLAAGGDSPVIHIWSLSNPNLEIKIDSGQRFVQTLAFSPDGARLASGGYDGTVKLWDFTAFSPEQPPELVQTLTGHNQWISTVNFSPDGKWLASGSPEQTVNLWQTDHRQPFKLTHTFKDHSFAPLQLIFQSDSQVLASSGANGIVRLWNVADFSLKKEFAVGNISVTALAFNPNGETLVTASGETGSLKLWSTQNFEELDTLVSYGGQLYTLAVNSEGTSLAAGGDEGTIFLWDLQEQNQDQNQNQNRPQKLKAHSGFITSILFRRDENSLISSSGDNTVRLWNLVRSKSSPAILESQQRALTIVLSPDNRFLISGADEGGLKLWSVISGELLFKLEKAHGGLIRSLALDPQGRMLASGAEDGLIKLWELDSLTATLTQRAAWPGEGELVMALSFNREGSVLFSGGSDGLIRTWDVVSGNCLARNEAHRGLIWALAYNAKARLLASGGDDELVQIWQPSATTANTSNGLERHSTFRQRGRVRTLAFSPNGNILYSAGENGRVEVWDLENDRSKTTLEIAPPYSGVDITDAIGLTEAQRHNLLALGAVDASNLKPEP